MECEGAGGHHCQVIDHQQGRLGGRQLEEMPTGSQRRALLPGRTPQPPPVLSPPRIHLMAGRVPLGADRAAVRSEMETVFLENLRHAAGVLAQVRPRTNGHTILTRMPMCAEGAHGGQNR